MAAHTRQPQRSQTLEGSQLSVGIQKTPLAQTAQSHNSQPKKKRSSNKVIYSQANLLKSSACARLGIPSALENPAPCQDNMSLFDLDIYQTLASDPQTRHVNFVQCPYGANATKPIRVLCWGADFEALDKGECPHKQRSWTYTQWNGKSATKWGKHLLLVNSFTRER
jgi:hypothetical protein